MKKKTLQKISRLFASLVLVGAMSLGTVAPVNAATKLEDGAWQYEETETAKAAITVVYKMGKDVETPKNTVSFEFTQGQDPDGTKVMPNLTVPNIVFNANDTQYQDTSVTDMKVLRKQSDDFLKQFYDYMKVNSNKMKSGEYTYTLVSKSTNAVASPDKFKASDAKYGVSIFVAQKANGDWYIKGTAFRELLDNNGNAGSNNKIDATPGTDLSNGDEASFSKMAFVNEYTKVTGIDTDTPDPTNPAKNAFTVSNTSTGQDAGMSTEFAYKMTLEAPSLSGIGTTYTYSVYEGTTKKSGGTGTYGQELGFKLSNGQTLIIAKGYAGTAVKVTQAGVGNWIPSVKYTFNNSSEKQQNEAMGKPLSVENQTLGKVKNAVNFINSYNSIAVTGIIVNNFPFVMMIVMAMAAFVAIVAVKSRRRMNER